MSVPYCKSRDQSFIICTTAIRGVTSAIIIYDFKKKDPIKVIEIPKNQRILSLDSFYDDASKKIVYITGDSTFITRVW